MDHSLHTPLTIDHLNEATLLDAVIYGPDDEKIGTVSHVHGMGENMQVILDIGGFLGIGAKPVAISVNALNFMRDEAGDIHATTAWSKIELQELPEHLD